MNEYLRKVDILNNYNALCKYIDDLACDYGELFTKATRTAQQLRDDVSPANHDNSSKAEKFSILLAQKKERLEWEIKKKYLIDAELEKLGVKNEYIVRQIYIERISTKKVADDLNMNYFYLLTRKKELVNRLAI